MNSTGTVPAPQRPGEAAPGSCQVAPRGQQDVDDLAVLIDCAVQVGLPAGDLQVGLIDEPQVPGNVPARASGLRKLRRQALDPPVDSDVIDRDAALSQQFLDIPVRQSLPQVPADRDRDHLGWEPEAVHPVAAGRAHAGPPCHRYFDTAHAILQATVDEDLLDLEGAVRALADSLPEEKFGHRFWRVMTKRTPSP